MVLLAVTVGVALVHLGPFNVLVAMAIAVTKAVLVVLYFMHVKYNSQADLGVRQRRRSLAVDHDHPHHGRLLRQVLITWRCPVLLEEPKDKTNTEDSEKGQRATEKSEFSWEKEKAKAKARRFFCYPPHPLSFLPPYLNYLLPLWPSGFFVPSVFVLSRAFSKWGLASDQRPPALSGFGGFSPSAVARSIRCSCSSFRISRMCSAMANSCSCSHCRTRSR